MMNIWTQLRHFTIGERWGDASKMNGALLLILEELRTNIGLPFVVHCGYETEGHSEYSEHYDGNAIDFHVIGADVKEIGKRILEILEALQVGDRVGFGIYMDWRDKGFHLDLRGVKARWARVDGEYVGINTVI